MNSNYQTAKFLANERVNDQLANAKYHRQAKRANKRQGDELDLTNIKPLLNESRQRAISGMVNILRGVGGARTATR